MAIDISRALAIDGWMSRGELQWLAERAERASVIIEVGCFLGRSTRALADHTKGAVYAVDPWVHPWVSAFPDDPIEIRYKIDHPEIFPEFCQNMADLTNLFYYRGTMEGLPLVRPDMVFIDGDHHYGAVASDIENAKHQLISRYRRHPVLLCGHDYGCAAWPEVTQAVDELVGPVQTHESIWWTQF